MLNEEQVTWLRSHLRDALLFSIILEIGAWWIFTKVVLIGKHWLLYLVFGVGIVLGAIIGCRHVGNPLKFSPMIRGRSLLVGDEEAVAWLSYYWVKFPRRYVLIAILVEWVFLAIIAIVTNSEEHGGQKYLCHALFAGLYPGIPLGSIAFWSWLLISWRRLPPPPPRSD